MQVAILVPRRAGIDDRDRIWAGCRAWWEGAHPDWPIVEGHHDQGLFNRSAAINRAAEQAGAWDVALIIDSDCVAEPAFTEEACQQAYRHDQMWQPFTTRLDIDPAGTSLFLAGRVPTQGLRRYCLQEWPHCCSMVVVVSRPLWEQVGGFDEGFTGWGFEDTAFAMACETHSGKVIGRINGPAWHFHHRPAKARREAHFEDNRARALLYRLAHQDRERTRALTDEGRLAR